MPFGHDSRSGRLAPFIRLLLSTTVLAIASFSLSGVSTGTLPVIPPFPPLGVERDSLSRSEPDSLLPAGGGDSSRMNPAEEDTLLAVPGGGTAATAVELRLRAEPESVQVRVDGELLPSMTPFELEVEVGHHVLEAVRDGYLPLDYELDVEAGDRITLRFLLMELEPSPLEPVDLGLEYLPSTPPLNLEQADLMRQRFNGFAEVFAIIPLGQGLLAKAIAGGGGGPGPDILIASGVTLSGGAYLLGSLLSARKRDYIQTRNEEITTANNQAKNHNRDVEKQLREANAEARAVWMNANRGRGRVDVTRH